jgi:hypothetical protein
MSNLMAHMMSMMAQGNVVSFILNYILDGYIK